jgi:uncharacterized protein
MATVRRDALVFSSPVLAPWRWPVFEVAAPTAGPRLCIMAGMHVNEVSSIEAAVQLQARVASALARGSVSILPILNLPALPYRSQYVCPVDGRNINFSFPGRPDGTFSEVLADAILREWSADAEVLIDLHGGDLCENVTKFSLFQQTRDAVLDRKNLSLARCFDSEIIVALDSSNLGRPGRACTACAERGRLAVMAEGGANGLIDAQSTRFHLNGVLNVMRTLKMIEEPPEPATRAQTIVGEYLWIDSPRAGLLYARAEPGARVTKGQQLAIVKDTYGQVEAEIVAPASGLILWRINHGLTTEGEQIFGLGIPLTKTPNVA